MSPLSWNVASSVAVCGALVVILGKRLLPRPRELDWDGWVVPLANRFAEAGRRNVTNNDQRNHVGTNPLAGKVIAITGATNGIGYSLTKALSKLGATIVAIGRSETKLQALRTEIPSVLTFQADLEDLHSVALAAKQMKLSLNHIDVLVNNAGIHDGYNQPGTAKDVPMDRVFVTNYLSHFLLTDQLLILLRRSNQLRPKVVQISSSFHWGVDGSDLINEATEDSMPMAARPGGSRIFRSQRSYANSKLAQILHARMLQKLHQDWLTVVNVCPGWVGTGIAGPAGSAGFRAIHQFGYPVTGWGIASSLYAILDSVVEKERDDFYSNTRIFELFRRPFGWFAASWSYQLGIRDVLAAWMAKLSLIGQHFFSDAYVTKSSLESYDAATAQALYEWSMQAISEFVPTEN